MAQYKIFKELTLPEVGSLEPHSIYLVAPAGTPDYVEVYITGATTSVVKRVIDENDVQALIDTAVSTLNALEVVADITARDALSLTANAQILVIDATDDSTVDSGAATYVWDNDESTFTKITEHESLDVIINWADIVGRPSSSVADIDDAVARKHSHANKTQLDLITENGDGEMLYNGALPSIAWDSVNW